MRREQRPLIINAERGRHKCDTRYPTSHARRAQPRSVPPSARAITARSLSEKGKARTAPERPGQIAQRGAPRDTAAPGTTRGNGTAPEPPRAARQRHGGRRFGKKKGNYFVTLHGVRKRGPRRTVPLTSCVLSAGFFRSACFTRGSTAALILPPRPARPPARHGARGPAPPAAPQPRHGAAGRRLPGGPPGGAAGSGPRAEAGAVPGCAALRSGRIPAPQRRGSGQVLPAPPAAAASRRPPLPIARAQAAARPPPCRAAGSYRPERDSLRPPLRPERFRPPAGRAQSHAGGRRARRRRVGAFSDEPRGRSEARAALRAPSAAPSGRRRRRPVPPRRSPAAHPARSEKRESGLFNQKIGRDGGAGGGGRGRVEPRPREGSGPGAARAEGSRGLGGARRVRVTGGGARCAVRCAAAPPAAASRGAAQRRCRSDCAAAGFVPLPSQLTKALSVRPFPRDFLPFALICPLRRVGRIEGLRAAVPSRLRKFPASPSIKNKNKSDIPFIPSLVGAVPSGAGAAGAQRTAPRHGIVAP